MTGSDPILDALAEAGPRGLTCRELVARGAAGSNVGAFAALLRLVAAGQAVRHPGERYSLTAGTG